MHKSQKLCFIYVASIKYVIFHGKIMENPQKLAIKHIISVQVYFKMVSGIKTR